MSWVSMFPSMSVHPQNESFTLLKVESITEWDQKIMYTIGFLLSLNSIL